MPATSTNIEALWHFTNKPLLRKQRAHWLILADAYDEEGDEISARFCRFIGTTMLVPSYMIFENRPTRKWHWFPAKGCGGRRGRNNALPTELLQKINEDMLRKDGLLQSERFKEWAYGSATRTRAYQFLFEIWHELPEESRLSIEANIDQYTAKE